MLSDIWERLQGVGKSVEDARRRLEGHSKNIDDALTGWHFDEAKTLGVKLGDRFLNPKHCEIRNIPRFGLNAHNKLPKAVVRFTVNLAEIRNEFEGGMPLLFSLYDEGVLFGSENGWRMEEDASSLDQDTKNVDAFIECD